MTLLQHIVALVTGSSLSPQFRKVRLIITGLIILVATLLLLFTSLLVSSNIYRGSREITTRNEARLIRNRPCPPRENCANPILEELNQQRIQQEILQVSLIILVIISMFSYLSLYYLLKPLSNNIREREDFVARASHELRTPLAILYSELSLGMGLTKIEPIQQILAESKDEVKRLQNLANNLLSQESHETQGNITKTNLYEIIVPIWARLSKSNPNNLTLHYNQKELEDFKLDNFPSNHKVLIDELFWNILDNAIKYGQARSSIELSTDKDKISCSNQVGKTFKLDNNYQKTHGLDICKRICGELGYEFSCGERDGVYDVLVAGF